ncbi:MAG: EVE domain-containing protein [Alphaproteobacteria bacterium]|nr:EVE domain-containing protein [Alphaproteobacteria bacterium]
MAHWLLKTEPGAWSWTDQRRVGVEPWTGVRNRQAARHLKAMRLGDRAFFYHSVAERSIVGVVEVVREAYPDPTDPEGRFVCVDVQAAEALPRPVTLAEIKADPAFGELALVRQSRLSVMPIDDESWALLRRMGGLEP